jgi:YHS domain-containing protein
MKKLFFLLILGITTSCAQTNDYNTKRGYAIDGYDVVSYFNNKPIEGTSDYVTEFDGVKFKFASEEHLNLFEKNPEKYVPQYGGYCAYAIGAKSSKVSIDPETFEIRDGKLYLFYNAWGTNTLELWQKEGAENLKEKADKNWETIKFKK